MSGFDYPTFLAARLVEAENDILSRGDEENPFTWYQPMSDIAAKRAILERYDQVKGGGLFLAEDGEWALNVQTSIDSDCLLLVIEHLCRPFKDHPDYPKDEQ